MLRSSLFTLIFFCSVVGYAQKGHYLLRHYSSNIVGIDNVNFDIAIDSNGLINLANRSGLLQFDGEVWEYTPAPTALLSLAIGPGNTVFAGGINDVGFFEYVNNQRQFKSLVFDKESEDLYFQTLISNGQVYFLSEHKVLQYHIEDKVLRQIRNPTNDFLISIFEVDDEVYVQSERELFSILNYELKSVSSKLPDFAEVQFVAKHPHRDEYLFGSTLNQLHLLREDSTFKTLKVSEEIVSGNYAAYDGSWITTNLLAISTYEGGTIVIDVIKDEIVEEINYESGLPDNEVRAVASDNDNGLWIAHEYGLTRVVPEIPLLGFTNYPGIMGNVLSMTETNGNVMVGTSSGVYYFDQETQYRNHVYYTTEKQETPEAEPSSQKVIETPTETKSNKRGGLGRLFKRKRKSFDDSKEADQEDEEKGFLGRIIGKISDGKNEVATLKGKPSPTVKYIRNVRRELISSRYLYRKVDGLDSKTRQLLNFKNRLLAVSSSGLFEIEDSVANLVYAESISLAHATDDYLLIVTDDHRLKVFELLDDLWYESGDYELEGEIVVNIFNDHLDRIWIISANSIYQFDPGAFNRVNLPNATIPNQYLDEVKAMVVNDKIYLINSSGYYYFHEGKRAVELDSSMYKSIGPPLRHLQQSDGTVWIFNGKAWVRIEGDGSHTTFQMLGLFPSISFIDQIGDDIWLIHDNRGLYRFDPSESQDIIHRNRMFIRSVYNPVGELDPRGDIRFSYDDNSITFELSRPDYLGISQIQYQYKLSGLMEDWSPWSATNTIDFNYLPPGKYNMLARSRDINGQVQESQSYAFTIRPPYWQTSWFYALQITLFVILVVGSARLNRGETKGRFFLLAEGLTLLTLILIIEFLQTVAGSTLGFESTPVIDFGVDVGTALLIFPIEIVLKKVIKSGADLTKFKKLLNRNQLDRI